MADTPARDAVVSGLADHGCCFDEVLAEAMVDAMLHEAFTAFAKRVRGGFRGEGPDEDNWILTPFDVAAMAERTYAPTSK